MELVGEEVVVEVAQYTAERAVAVGQAEVAAIGAKAQLGSARVSGLAGDLQDAAHGVGAVKNALTAAQQLDASGAGEGQGTKVKVAAGIADRNAIHEDLVVVAVSAAHEERRLASAIAAVAKDDAGQEAKSIGGGDGLHGLELRGVQRADVHAGESGFDGRGRGRDDDRLRDGAHSQADV